MRFLLYTFSCETTFRCSKIDIIVIKNIKLNQNFFSWKYAPHISPSRRLVRDGSNDTRSLKLSLELEKTREDRTWLVYIQWRHFGSPDSSAKYDFTFPLVEWVILPELKSLTGERLEPTLLVSRPPLLKPNLGRWRRKFTFTSRCPISALFLELVLEAWVPCWQGVGTAPRQPTGPPELAATKARRVEIKKQLVFFCRSRILFQNKR